MIAMTSWLEKSFKKEQIVTLPSKKWGIVLDFLLGYDNHLSFQGSFMIVLVGVLKYSHALI
jgi:hypothetical protein